MPSMLERQMSHKGHLGQSGGVPFDIVVRGCSRVPWQTTQGFSYTFMPDSILEHLEWVMREKEPLLHSKTIRQALFEELLEGMKTVRELSQALRVSEKEVINHLT